MFDGRTREAEALGDGLVVLTERQALQHLGLSVGEPAWEEATRKLGEPGDDRPRLVEAGTVPGGYRQLLSLAQGRHRPGLLPEAGESLAEADEGHDDVVGVTTLSLGGGRGLEVLGGACPVL